MKYSLSLGLLLLALLTAGSSTARTTAAASTKKLMAGTGSSTEKVRQALERFYRAYAGWIAASYNEHPEKPALPLDKATRRKVEKAVAETAGIRCCGPRTSTSGRCRRSGSNTSRVNGMPSPIWRHTKTAASSFRSAPCCAMDSW
ncbi:hypothetical protein B5G09_08180 [Alistipes sp. An54]|nr:hypothetical protein B5G09_08180 [Alistipes sp. An54]